MNVRIVLFVLAILIRASPSEAQALLPESKRLAHKPGIALALSGGGARGFAHIGVLDILDSAHIPIDLIAGSSIGAVIGGLYAAGYSPAQLEHFAEVTNWRDVLDLEDDAHRMERVLSQKDADNALLSLRFTGLFNPVIPQAISSGQRLTMLLNSMVINAPGGVPQDFLRDMRVPFVAVTTDIVAGKRRLLTRGDLTEALRASATLPLRFNPLPQDSAILMDGGLIANIPVDVVRSFGASRVIVSNTTARLRGRDDLNTPWDIADQVISLMMQRQDAEQLKQADLVITPQVAENNDYTNLSAAIEAGRAAARKMLPAIFQLLSQFAGSSQGAGEVADTLMPSLRAVRLLGTMSVAASKSLATALQTASNPFLGMALLRSENMRTIERKLLEAYRSEGYSLARIDSVVVHPAIGLADLFVDEGHISNIEFRGDRGDSKGSRGSRDAVAPDFVMHELPFTRGDIFRAQEADEALRNLTGTGLFDFAMLQIAYDTLWPGTQYESRWNTTARNKGERVRYENSNPSFGPVVLVTVRGRAPNVLRLGVLADNEYGAQFSAELASENLQSTGLEASLKAGLAPFSRFASFTLDAPRLLHSFALLEAQIYSNYKDINAYSLQTITNDNRLVSSVTDVIRESRDIGMLFRAGGQIERLGKATIEIRHERQRWFSVRDNIAPVETLSLTALRGALVVDSRNDAAYPHLGTLLQGYAETGLPALGGEAAYTKLFAEIEQAIPLSNLHTLIPRFQIGFGDVPLPRLEQFYLGGMESFYGLNEYELRGRQVIEASLTYQIAIPHVLFFPTFVSIRYDLGWTWPEPTQIKFESLVHGIGAQVGLRTPLGLARFAIGENFRFNQDKPHPIDLNKPLFYFSLGSQL